MSKKSCPISFSSPSVFFQKFTSGSATQEYFLFSLESIVNCVHTWWDNSAFFLEVGSVFFQRDSPDLHHWSIFFALIRLILKGLIHLKKKKKIRSTGVYFLKPGNQRELQDLIFYLFYSARNPMWTVFSDSESRRHPEEPHQGMYIYNIYVYCIPHITVFIFHYTTNKVYKTTRKGEKRWESWCIQVLLLSINKNFVDMTQ